MLKLVKYSYYYFQNAKIGSYVVKYPTLVVEILLISLNKALQWEVLKYEYILIKTGSDEILRKKSRRCTSTP